MFDRLDYSYEAFIDNEQENRKKLAITTIIKKIDFCKILTNSNKSNIHYKSSLLLADSIKNPIDKQNNIDNYLRYKIKFLKLCFLSVFPEDKDDVLIRIVKHIFVSIEECINDVFIEDQHLLQKQQDKKTNTIKKIQISYNLLKKETTKLQIPFYLKKVFLNSTTETKKALEVNFEIIENLLNNIKNILIVNHLIINEYAKSLLFSENGVHKSTPSFSKLANKLERLISEGIALEKNTQFEWYNYFPQDIAFSINQKKTLFETLFENNLFYYFFYSSIFSCELGLKKATAHKVEVMFAKS